MTQAATKEVPLMKYLIELAKKEDRGKLAALRSGLGKPPGAAPRMLPILAPFLHEDEGPAVKTAFLTAALFGSHPEHAEVGSLGASLWKATKRQGNPNGKYEAAGVETRFAAALDADPEDLPRHLQGLVSLCESAGVPINWHRFWRDVRGLLGQNDDYKTSIRTRWAREFWRGPRQHVDSTQKTQEDNQQ